MRLASERQRERRMDWVSGLGVAAIVISGGLLLEVARIRKHLHLNDWTPTKKWLKGFKGPRHVPQHKPDKVSQYADEHDLRFYRDTAGIADWLNDLYADTPWSFENTGELDCALSGTSEREIHGWYNEVQTCWLTVSTRSYKPDRNRQVTVEFELINGRAYPGLDVAVLCMEMAGLLGRNADHLRDARDQVQTVMLAAMWQLGGDFGNEPINVRFSGELAEHIINWERSVR
jgi:hypothetical protein